MWRWNCFCGKNTGHSESRDSGIALLRGQIKQHTYTCCIHIFFSGIWHDDEDRRLLLHILLLLLLFLLLQRWSPLYTLFSNMIFLYFLRSLFIACLCFIAGIFKFSSISSLCLLHGLPTLPFPSIVAVEICLGIYFAFFQHDHIILAGGFSGAFAKLRQSAC